jgi:hypothetical protein
MRRLHQLCCWIVLLGLTACSSALMGPDPNAVAISQDIYAELVLDRKEAVLARLAGSENNTPEKLGAIATMRSFIPDGAAQAAELIGWRGYAGTDGQRMEITHRYRYDDQIVIFVVNFGRTNDLATWTPVRLHVAPAPPDYVSAPSIAKAGKVPPIKAEAGDLNTSKIEQPAPAATHTGP